MTGLAYKYSPVYSQPPLLSSRGSCAPGGKAVPFPPRGKCAHSAPPAARLTGPAEPLGPRLLRGGSRAHRVHSAGGERPARQAQRGISADPGRPAGAGLVVLPPEAHPAGRSAGLVRRLGDAGPPLPAGPPPCPAGSGSRNCRGLTGLSPRRLKESLRRLEAARAAGLVGIRRGVPGLARGRPPARPRRLRAVPRPHPQPSAGWCRFRAASCGCWPAAPAPP